MDRSISSEIVLVEEFPDQIVTSLSSVVQSRNIVLILGTSSGNVMKVEFS